MTMRPEGRDTGFHLADFESSGDYRSPTGGADYLDAPLSCGPCGDPSPSWHVGNGTAPALRQCQVCGAIHHPKPTIVVRCISELKGRLLLCRRNDLPRKGFWTIPGGFLENGETLYDAAVREVREEAEAELTSLNLFCIYEMPQLGHVVVIFFGRLSKEHIRAGLESSEVHLFHPRDLPWTRLAFPTDKEAIEAFLHDRDGQEFTVRLAQFHWGGDRVIRVRDAACMKGSRSEAVPSRPWRRRWANPQNENDS